MRTHTVALDTEDSKTSPSDDLSYLEDTATRSDTDSISSLGGFNQCQNFKISAVISQDSPRQDNLTVTDRGVKHPIKTSNTSSGTLVTFPILSSQRTNALDMPYELQDSFTLLAFNISCPNLAMLADFFERDGRTNPALFFADGTGFMQIYETMHQLQLDVAQIELILIANKSIHEKSYNNSLEWLLTAVQHIAISHACRKLNTESPERAKEVAIAACLRESDWIVYAIPDWPNKDHSTYNKQFYLNNIVEYVAITLLATSYHNLRTDVRNTFRVIEATSEPGGSVVAVVRLAPEFDREKWAIDAFLDAMSAESRRPYGFRANGICHSVHPATVETLTSIIRRSEEEKGNSPGNEHHEDANLRPPSPYDLSQRLTCRPVNYPVDLAVRNLKLAPITAGALHGTQQGAPALNLHLKTGQALQNSRSFTMYNGRGISDTNAARSNGIDINRIYRGLDVRTTIMLRNLPNRLTHEDLYDYLLSACPGEFDFLYVRIDFSNGCNVGYGFVNLVSPQSVIGFVEKFRGFRWPGSEKIAEVSYATQQGREALISRFRNSSVMTKGEASRPKLYYPLGHPLAGMEEPFPEPDNLAKLQRSQQNADTEGLYETRGRRSGVSLLRHRNGPHDPQAIRRDLDDEASNVGSNNHRSWLKTPFELQAGFQQPGAWNWARGKHH